MKFHFITPVWGKDFTSIFTSYCLPTQLSALNLGSFTGNDTVVYRIMTRECDAEDITKSASFKLLSNMVPTEVTFIDHLWEDLHAYFIKSKCFNWAIENDGAAVGETAFVFLTADLAWADGSFHRMKQILESGKRAVLLTGFRVKKEQFCPELIARFGDEQGPVFSCPARPLVQLGLEHIHPISAAMMWDNKQVINRLAAHLYWKQDGPHMLGRSWVFHPLAVRPRRFATMTDQYGRGITTVDHAYVMLACPDYTDLYLSTDSDEMFVLEMSDTDYSQLGSIEPGTYTPAVIVNWLASDWTTPYHLRYVHEYIWYHADDVPQTVQKVLERKSDKVIHLIERERRRVLLAYNMRSFINRRIRPAIEPFLGACPSAARGFLKRVYNSIFSGITWLLRSLKRP